MMAQEEIYGTRDRSYSAWHRRESTRRFIGIENAQLLAMIDLDASLYVEYDDGTKDPIALIETAQDVDQPYKTATVTANLSKLCTERVLPAYVVLYKLSDEVNPADRNYNDIVSFRVKRLWPSPEKTWTTYTADEWAQKLLSLRTWSAKRVDAIA